MTNERIETTEEREQRQLFHLACVDPAIARQVDEYKRLRELTTNPDCRQWLTLMIDGWLSAADNHLSGWLNPIVPTGSVNYKGSDTVNDIAISTVRYTDGTSQPFSTWYCESFPHRLSFLQTGLAAIGYQPGLVCPLQLTVHPADIGITL